MINWRSLKKNIVVSLAVLTSASVLAQNTPNDCSSSIVDAGNMYEAGKFEESVKLLNACLDFLPQETRFEAYRLLGLAYLELNDEEKLNESMVNLLKEKPDYREFPFFDPLAYTVKLSKFDVYPKWEIGLQAGINSTSVSPIENYSVTGSEASYLPKTGYQIGILSEYYFNQKMSLYSGLQLSGVNYERNADDVVGWKQMYIEKLQFINVPIVLKHKVIPELLGWQVSAEAGINYQFLATTRSVVFLDNLSESNPKRLQRSADQSEARSKYVISGLLGISAKRKVAKGSFNIQIASSLGINNLVKPENRWDNLTFITESNYVDSDIRLNTVMISVGYQRAIRGKHAVELRE